MKQAVLVRSAHCNGSGSDRYKSIAGLTQSVRAKIEALENEHQTTLAILVPSHSRYMGQQYKLAVDCGHYGFNHRQINDADYEIVATID